MEKSFYHVIAWTDAQSVIEKLTPAGIPYAIEQTSKLPLSAGKIAFVFPDLPVREYGALLEILGSHGRRYK